MRRLQLLPRQLGILIFSICLSACGDGGESRNLLTGSARASCSPVDGVATRFEFPIENQQILIFGLNRSVDKLVGQWKIGNGDAVDGLSVSLCPSDFKTPCHPIENGVMRIDRVADKTVYGNWLFTTNLALPKDTDFNAKLTSVTQPLCG